MRQGSPLLQEQAGERRQLSGAGDHSEAGGGAIAEPAELLTSPQGLYRPSPRKCRNAVGS